MAEAPVADRPRDQTPDEEFAQIIDELARSSHGSECLQRLRTFFEARVGKTKDRVRFLQDRLIRPPIKWVDIQESTWGTPEEREANQFEFLQGDIVHSNLVLAVTGARYDHDDLWMILSADCDCVRGEFVRVAQVVPIDASASHEVQIFALAVKFANEKAFPIPCLPEDNPGSTAGYVVNLEVPAYLWFGQGNDSERALVTQRASLTEAAWHILNAIMLHQLTRANLEEALRIRRAS